MDRFTENKLDVFISLTKHVNEICRPLFLSTHINVFGYVKIKANDSLIYLCSETDWLEYFFHKNYHSFLTPTYYPEIFNYKYIFGSALKNNQVIFEAEQYFNYSHAFMLTHRHNDETELFIFAADKDNHVIENWYVNSIQHLQQFCTYFKSAIQDLIEDIRVIQIPSGEDISEISDTGFIRPKEIIGKESFPKKIPVSDSKEEFYITPHELQCIKYMCQGKSAHEIADLQCRSPRTIETHIQNIKRKLNCSKRSEVIQKAIESNLCYFFDKVD